MPVVESRRVVPVPPDVAFAVSQTQGAIRKRWDPFIAHQHLMGGATEPAQALAIWRYGFACRPAWLAPVAERIGAWILQRDMDRRIDGFARGCADPGVLAHVGAGAVASGAS